MTDDSKLIESLGGPARVAELLGYDRAGGVQRVHNWRSRGIPPRVKVERPDLFMRPQLAENETHAQPAPAVAARLEA